MLGGFLVEMYMHIHVKNRKPLKNCTLVELCCPDALECGVQEEHDILSRHNAT